MKLFYYYKENNITIFQRIDLLKDKNITFCFKEELNLILKTYPTSL
jgi:hypothetical protein